MVLFAVEFEPEDKILNYLETTKSNLSSNNMLRNPFSGSVRVKGNIAIVDMVPLYPNPIWLCIIVAIPILIFTRGISWWLIIPFLFLLGSIPHSGWFVYQIFKKGVKKAGYIGHLNKLSKDECIRKVL
jgi:hypothetical protein